MLESERGSEVAGRRTADGNLSKSGAHEEGRTLERRVSALSVPS